MAEKLVNVRVGGGGDGVRVGGQGGDGGVPRREVVRSSVDDGDDGQVGERGRGEGGGLMGGREGERTREVVGRKMIWDGRRFHSGCLSVDGSSSVGLCAHEI